MFASLGASVCRRPWHWLIGWVVVAAVLWLSAPSRERVALVEPASMIPADEPYNVATDLERRAFPALASRTRTVLLFARNTGLSADDHAYLAALTHKLEVAGEGGGAWRVQSPVTQPYLRPRLLSADGQVAIIVVHTDVNYVTHRSIAYVERIESLAKAGLPDGLTFDVTGSGGLGRDLAAASQAALARTTWVTVGALLLILALVHRAPLAAVVPLLTVGTSVYVALAALDLLTLVGWGISDTEKTFAVVLLFGSGVDFSLFWMSRYRERLGTGGARREAFIEALVATGPAIATSAATTIFGFLMLLAADLLPSHNAGRALGLALAIALVAAVTLVPAVSWLLGRWLFWPRRAQAPPVEGGGGLWTSAGRWVSRHPVGVVVVVLLLLAGPVWSGLGIRYRYDALGVVPTGSGSARGRALAEEHFGASRLFSWSCLVEAPGAVGGDGQAELERARTLASVVREVDGVTDVWSLAEPLGARFAGSLAAAVVGSGGGSARPYYVSDDPPCLRFEVMLGAEPFSERAMQTCQRVLEQVARRAEEVLGGPVQVHATGLTPYIINVRGVFDADQRRVTVLVIAVIGLGWVRDPALTVCMVAATLAVYAATLGVTDWFFDDVLGAGRIDYKVRLFLFVVLVAVGQDYNIFVVSRIRQERRLHPPGEAVRRAVGRTGSVISSCGLIMAATMGSLAATGLPLLQQLGFGFAFGVLLDTFVVRPLLVPGLYLLVGRKGSAQAGKA